MDILAKAKELGTAIGNSAEMTNLKECEAKVHQDKHAESLLSDYKLLQIEMVKATKENRSSEVIEDIKRRLLDKQEEINTYETTNNFLEAKSTFDSFMKKINDVIVFGITGEEPCSPHKCGSCGGGCK